MLGIVKLEHFVVMVVETYLSLYIWYVHTNQQSIAILHDCVM